MKPQAREAVKKTCSRCKEEKNPSEFHKDSKKLDGLSPWCKPCKNGRSVELMREKLQDPSSIQSIRKKIYYQVDRAIANGTLVKPEKCPVCRVKVKPSELQGHHHDYSKPLDVEWICRQCHIRQHKEERHEDLPLCVYCGKRRTQMSLATCGSETCVIQAKKIGARDLALRNKDVRADARLATGERMKALMEEHGYTKADLAKHLGVSTSYITQVFQRVEEIRADREQRAEQTTPTTTIATEAAPAVTAKAATVVRRRASPANA